MIKWYKANIAKFIRVNYDECAFTFSLCFSYCVRGMTIEAKVDYFRSGPYVGC